MKSRRRIAFPQGSGQRSMSLVSAQLRQEFATGEMGLNSQFALQKS
jgi:hypothetical protein